MKACGKEFLFIFLVHLLLLLFPFRSDAAAETVLVVGTNEEIQTLSEAFEQLPENSGDTRILVQGNLTGEPNVSLSIPTNKGITSLTIENSAQDTPVTIEPVIEIFANGIPFVLGENVSLPNAWIFGGMLAINSTIRTVPQTSLTILGSAAYVVGGGAANSGGRSVVTGSTEVILGSQGIVFWQLFGGGYALGKRSIAEIRISNVEIFGKADYVLGGGLAKENGRTIVRERANATINPGGSAAIALFGGGNAVGEGSISETEAANATIYGTAAWAFGGDFTFQGGQSLIPGTAEITVAESGSVNALYGGSFATDKNSRSEVAKTVLNVAGSVGTVTSEGETSYEGVSVVSDPDRSF